MAVFPVAETFLSINGEGTHAGQLAFFIRFTGCNLRCSYCDTAWANEPDAPHTAMTAEDLLDAALRSGAGCVTITGGEPMLQPDIAELLRRLCDVDGLYVEVETNGAVPLERFLSWEVRPSFTMDYKLPSSGMESRMHRPNLSLLTRQDTVKFVCGSQEDLRRAEEIIRHYGLVDSTHVYLSPVFGQIEPSEMVEYMMRRRLRGVTLQLQIHKIIWDPEKRGV